MSNNFDKKLVNRMNHVFDNYEDDSAVEGWAKLQQKFPEKEKKKRFGIYWISGVAAALLILFGIWLSVDIPSGDTLTVAKPHKIDLPDTTSATVVPSTDALPQTTQVDQPQPERLSAKARSVIKKNKPTLSAPVIKQEQQLTAYDRMAIGESQNQLTEFALLPPKTNRLDTAKTSEAYVIAQADDTEKPMANLQSYDALTKLSETKELDSKKSTKTSKDFVIGLVGGSYVNYAKGSQSGINTGIGLLSEFKISKRMSISTGISIGQNSLEFKQEIPEQASRSYSSAISKSQMDMPTQSLEGLVNIVAPSYNIDTYNAKLTGLDIPVNIKYSLANKETNIYVLAGVSSNYFINESYTYDIDYLMNYNKNQAGSTQQESLNGSQTFNFAKTLNFSLGFDYPINKSLGLSVAPFVKVPIGGLGENHLRFGATGLNLNLNFNRLK